ncbi:hybrid sensor histidine kinase/response regulator [Brasilonema octagenarum]|uniref:hybrid sensor histidine kinase/response regulator n=1 Tax=Brasilonema octagenarum TaxID=417105 RepID=UPI00351A6236
MNFVQPMADAIDRQLRDYRETRAKQSLTKTDENISPSLTHSLPASLLSSQVCLVFGNKKANVHGSFKPTYSKHSTHAVTLKLHLLKNLENPISHQDKRSFNIIGKDIMNLLLSNNEAARLVALHQYDILDTAPEQAFDDLAFLAAQTCATPIAVITLIDTNRQWFKAKVGLDVEEMPVDIGFCPFCIQQRDILIIPDTLSDERFATNPVVTSAPYVRFYAGVPLVTPEGHVIGVVCVVDRVPRKISHEQVESLKAISRLVIRQLELRRNLTQLASIKAEYQQAKQKLPWKEELLRSMTGVSPLAEQQVREQAVLVDIVTDAIIVRDLSSSRILLWNKSAENLYGWKAEETLGKKTDEIFSNEPLPQYWEIYKNVLKSGSWQGELQTITKSGKKIIVESRWTLVRDEHFQPKSIVVVDTDITEKKQLEKQFLRHQRLESIGTLASGIAHDLNNVLSPILMSVPMLKASCDDERSRQVLTIVENNAKRGANLVKQVLSFARGTEGDWENSSSSTGDAHKGAAFGDRVGCDYPKPSSHRGGEAGNACAELPCGSQSSVGWAYTSDAHKGAAFGNRTVLQLNELISEMTQIIEQTFPKSIVVKTEIQPSLLPFCGDSTQIHQVLMNLCLNARDAMINGGTLQISAKNIFIDQNFAKMHLDAQVGSYIVLTVYDTGIGIPNELLDRIFEPFFTTKEFGKGTGLGLSTVMGIIKGHAGFMTVSSSVGKGTKFQVYLPAIKTAATQLTVDRKNTPTGHGEWILVVDDEPAIREITKVSLEKNNYKAMTASDGIEAVALYAQHKDKISAAIVDMIMPDMDGITTINTLHKMNPLLHIIAVSGLATSEQMLLDKASELIAFLPKPHTAQELLNTLHSVISHH